MKRHTRLAFSYGLEAASFCRCASCRCLAVLCPCGRPGAGLFAGGWLRKRGWAMGAAGSRRCPCQETLGAVSAPGLRWGRAPGWCGGMSTGGGLRTPCRAPSELGFDCECSLERWFVGKLGLRRGRGEKNVGWLHKAGWLAARGVSVVGGIALSNNPLFYNPPNQSSLLSAVELHANHDSERVLESRIACIAPKSKQPKAPEVKAKGRRSANQQSPCAWAVVERAGEARRSCDVVALG